MGCFLGKDAHPQANINRQDARTPRHGALAKPTSTLALPCHPQDSFSRLHTTIYQELMPDPFESIRSSLNIKN